MGKFILGVMCMVVALLFSMLPAEALDWEQDNSMSVGFLWPAVWLATGSTWVEVAAHCTWEKNRCVDSVAYVTTKDYTQRPIPATLVVNAQATHAVLQFLDGSGSVMTWQAMPGQQQVTEFTQTLRGHIQEDFDLPLRYLYSSTHNYAYVSGTLLGETLDTREWGVPYSNWNQIVRRFERWLDAPAPVQPAVK